MSDYDGPERRIDHDSRKRVLGMQEYLSRWMRRVLLVAVLQLVVLLTTGAAWWTILDDAKEQGAQKRAQLAARQDAKRTALALAQCRRVNGERHRINVQAAVIYLTLTEIASSPMLKNQPRAREYSEFAGPLGFRPDTNCQAVEEHPLRYKQPSLVRYRTMPRSFAFRVIHHPDTPPQLPSRFR